MLYGGYVEVVEEIIDFYLVFIFLAGNFYFGVYCNYYCWVIICSVIVCNIVIDGIKVVYLWVGD